MADIFDNTILCKNCNKKMVETALEKEGFNLRAVKCPTCKNHIIHPEDLKEYEEFMKLKKKEYEVKMRMVGNSYAVSIPREIVSFMQEQERMMDDMVRLSFEDMGRISLMFHTQENENEFGNNNSDRIVKAREVRVVRNGKQVYHRKQFKDSSHPEKNKDLIFKSEGKENDR